jgi:hypothetical protein
MRNGFSLLIRDHMGLIDEKKRRAENLENLVQQSFKQKCPPICDIALDHCPALCGIALDKCPALCRIALAQNCIALRKSTKVSGHATFFKEAIDQKIVHTWISLYKYQIKFKSGCYLTKNFCPALCHKVLVKSLRSNCSANSKQNSKIF